MTTHEMAALDRDTIRELFDLRSAFNNLNGGDYQEDPYPVWAELRETGPIHEGTVHELSGYPGDAMFHGLPEPERPHYSIFSYEACDTAYRDEDLFASSADAIDPDLDGSSLLNRCSA